MKKGLIVAVIAIVVLAVVAVIFYSLKEPETKGISLPTPSEENKTIKETGATYMLTFISTWSKTNHPEEFPSNPHWSGLIGASHKKELTIWKRGRLSTDGVEEVAETGSKTKLIPEINDHITSGSANQVISGGGINPSPGEVSMTFNMTEDYPLVSVISMIAPSPDWFVGVDSLNLFENGKWIEEKEIDLMIYDAGTDSGRTYTSSNDDTSPREPIAITGYTGLSEKSVGKFIFKKI